jgi:hypothetical protein
MQKQRESEREREKEKEREKERKREKKERAKTCAEFLLDCFLTLLAALPFERFEPLHHLCVGVRIVAVPSE